MADHGSRPGYMHQQRSTIAIIVSTSDPKRMLATIMVLVVFSLAASDLEFSSRLGLLRPISVSSSSQS